MAIVFPLGLVAQRWMTYELLGVDGGVGAVCLAFAMLVVIGSMAAALVGVPSYVVINRLGLTGTRRAIAVCGLASAVTAIAHRAVAPFGTTTVDHAVPVALSLIFFAVFYASFSHDFSKGSPTRARSGRAPRAAGPHTR